MTEDARSPTGPTRARRALVGWALGLALLYGCFFQGGGWNQNARFDTVRALVERGSFEITPFAGNTGDVVEVEGRLFANKPPGHAVIAAPFYFALFHGEGALGLSPDDPAVASANAYLIGWFTGGLPAAALAVLLSLAFQRRGASRREALLLASAFATGSLVLPYSGLGIAHNLTACLLFGAWLSIGEQATTPFGRSGFGRSALAGALLGWAVLCDYLAAPAAALLVGYALWLRPTGRQAAALLVGPAVCASILLAHNLSSFGEPFANPYTATSARFKDAGLWLGIFDWPQPIRLYWLTLHPFRGLLYCCPVFFVPVFALLRRPGWEGIRSDGLVAAAIVASFLLFNLSFNGWTGGWGVGPRYLIPAMPFLFLPALAGWRRLPRISAALALVSTLFMLCVSAVAVLVPGPNTGDAPDLNPLAETASVLSQGYVSISNQSFSEKFPEVSEDDRWDSWNLGELIGLEGWASLLPVVVLVLAIYGLAGAPWRRVRGDADGTR